MDRIPSVVRRYVLAILSVAMALGISSLLLKQNVQGVLLTYFMSNPTPLSLTNTTTPSCRLSILPISISGSGRRGDFILANSLS